MLRRFIVFAAFTPLIVLAYTSPGKPSGFVNDFAGVLSLQDKAGLETKLDNFQKATGNELSVVLVKSLGGDTVENYANSLFNEWGIGQKDKNNGILFLAAIDDHEMRIEVGYGLEPLLTDAQSYWIEQNQIVPAFRNGDYAGGVNAGVDKIIAAVSGTEQIPSATQTKNQPGNFRLDGNVILFFLFIPVWLASILARSKSWWLGGVLGAVAGIIIGIFFGFIFAGLISIAVLTVLGLVFDYFVSKAYAKSRLTGRYPWWIGGGRGGRGGPFGGGFGGFGGGSSGGGGSSSKW